MNRCLQQLKTKFNMRSHPVFNSIPIIKNIYQNLRDEWSGVNFSRGLVELRKFWQIVLSVLHGLHGYFSEITVFVYLNAPLVI